MKLSERMHDRAGDGVGEREFVSVYFMELHKDADEVAQLEAENERLRDEYKSVMSLIAMMVHQSGGELKVPMVLLRGDEELVTWNSGMDFYIKFDDALKEGE